MAQNNAFVHEITLPSKGLPYVTQDGKALIPGGSIQIREFSGDDEDILNATTLNDPAKIEKIVTNCVILPPTAKGFDPLDLLTTDRLVILMVARALSLTPTYQIPVECDTCPNKWTHSFNLLTELNPLEMPRKNSAGVELVYDPINGIPLKLPKTGIELTLQLLTGRSNRFLLAESQKARSPFVAPGVANVQSMLLTLLTIKTIDGKVLNQSNLADMQAASELVRSMPLSDRRLIRSTTAAYDVGIESDYTITCPVCSAENKIGLAFTPEFFRPADM